LLKLGLFGGTFNPVHYGHLICAERIREFCSLQKIIFVPSKRPVHKELAGAVAPEHRYRMIELALEANPLFDVSDIEIKRKKPSFTIFTVTELLDRHPDADLYLIVGHDAYREIETWRDYRDLLDLVTLVVMQRTGEVSSKVNPAVKGKRVVFAENPVIEISSTDIRNRIRQGRSTRYLLPENVRSYIEEMGLYRA